MISLDNAFLLQRRKTAIEKLFKALFLQSRATMNDGTAEIGMLSSLIPKGSTTIDVGANVGEFSRRMSDISDGGLVIAIEPQSMPRAVMSLAGFCKAKSNILVVAVALGDRSGLVELSVPLKSKGNVGVGLAHIGDDEDLRMRFEVKKELVALTTLDEVVRRIETGPISLVKIDVEGGELAVVRGAVETIDKHRPVFLCEIDSREDRFNTTEDGLAQFFRSLNYIPRRVNDLREISFDCLEKNTVFTPEEIVI